MEPTETKALNPTSSRRLQSRTAGQGAGEGGVQTRERAHHAHAVGTDDAHRATPLQDFPFQRRAGFTYLAETGRDDDRPFHAGLCALGDDARNGCGRRGHDRQIYFLGDIRDAGIRFDPEHGGALGVHGIDSSAEGCGSQVRQQRQADAARRFRGADDRYAARLEECI
jgi:hypothetical protein